MHSVPYMYIYKLWEFPHTDLTLNIYLKRHSCREMFCRSFNIQEKPIPSRGRVAVTTSNMDSFGGAIPLSRGNSIGVGTLNDRSVTSIGFHRLSPAIVNFNMKSGIVASLNR